MADFAFDVPCAPLAVKKYDIEHSYSLIDLVDIMSIQDETPHVFVSYWIEDDHVHLCFAIDTGSPTASQYDRDFFNQYAW